MPLEIRELHIKAKVAADQGGQSNSSASTGSGGGANDKDAIISECIEKIMQILKDKMER